MTKPATSSRPWCGDRSVVVRAVSIVFLLGLVIVQSGCSPIFSSVSSSSLVSSGRYHVNTEIVVPEVDGAAGCGAQAFAAALAYCDPAIDANELVGQLPWQDDGATPVDLLLEARLRGFHAEIVRGNWKSLIDLAESDRAPIVMLDVAPVVPTLFSTIPTGKAMHWAVVSGCNSEGTVVLLGAPNDRHHVVKQSDFLTRWGKSDCCIIIVYNGSSPPSGD